MLTFKKTLHNIHKRSVFTTVVSRIHAPSFANLALVKSIGELIYRIRHFIFILREYTPSSGATPIDTDLGLRPSTPQVSPFNVLIALTPLADTLAIDRCRIP